MQKLKRETVLILLGLFLASSLMFSFVQEEPTLGLTDEIKVDQVGYLPSHKKLAFVTGSTVKPGAKFYVKEANTGTTVYTGMLSTQSFECTDSGDTIYSADFSDLAAPGSYYLEVEGVGRSFNFDIQDNIYNELFYHAMRFFYYQRCGMDLEAPYAGKWTHKACHLNDAVIHSSAVSEKRPEGTLVSSPGGWHDAGDYGKKIVNAGITVATLLRLYEMFPERVGTINLNIPESANSMPDILDEVKYELDWMLTMQRPDGAVYHNIVTSSFASMGTAPENDSATRYFGPVSSCATADFAGAMAMAARIYENFDPLFAQNCLDAAEKAWEHLENHPNIFPSGGYTDPEGIHGTGGYYDTDDSDERFWAAAELFRTTGKTKYNEYVKANYSRWGGVHYPESWRYVNNLGMFAYAFATQPEVDVDLQNQIRSSIVDYANSTLSRITSTGYRVALNSDDYYWGSNSIAMYFAAGLIIANEIQPKQEFIEGALDQLHYILGRNALNHSFVTGMGENCTRYPWHTWICNYPGDPPPGLLSGGPDKYKAPYDKILCEIIDSGAPPAKCYADNCVIQGTIGTWASNEPCISYNAPLVFVAGYFLT